jgi:hypothetical protein
LPRVNILGWHTAKIETPEKRVREREREKRNLWGFRYIFEVDRVANELSSFFIPVSFEFFASVYMHARIDSSLTVASASARRTRIENWERTRAREEKRERRGKGSAPRRLREVIFVEQEKKDSRKLGEPRGPCECQQPFALYTLLLGVYGPPPVPL